MRKRSVAIVFVILIVLALAGSLLLPAREPEPIQEMMKDAVLHEVGKLSLFGLMEVNPAVIAAFSVTAVLLTAAALLRIFLIPRMQFVPGKVQLMLEEGVRYFYMLAKTNSPGSYRFLGAYVFAAGVYISFSTLWELFGFQVISTEGRSLSLPAPLSDINAAIAMGFLSYLVILGGGLVRNGFKGLGRGLKDFSLPLSMSFRLFGALLSGLLVNELIYYTIRLSLVLPVVVAVLFTLIHALIQAYVLTMLTSIFYGECALREHAQNEK